MTPPHNPIRLDKAVGLMIGAAVGDALGWPQENRSQIVGGASAREVPAEPNFRNWIRNGGTQYGRYTDPVRPGEYSDDTQLTLSVARAVLRGDDWLRWLTRVELPTWPLFERGGGGAVLTASRAWADGRPPWAAGSQRNNTKVSRYFNAGANGVAMRIAPHVLCSSTDDPRTLLLRVVRDGLSTHGHPRALVGACIHALAIRHAILREGTLEYGELVEILRAEPSWRDPTLLLDSIDAEWATSYQQFADPNGPRAAPDEVWTRTSYEVEDLLRIAQDGLARGATANDHRTLTQLGCFDNKQSGSGTVTAAAAVYVAARTAARPMSGLMRTGFLKNADTDTLCSMTGSLLGALHGPEWMGRLYRDVQDRDYITELTLDVVNPNRESNYRTQTAYAPLATTTSSLRQWNEALFSGQSPEMGPDGRSVRLLDMHELATRTKNFVARALLVTKDGQTLIVDRVAKSPAAALSPPRYDSPNESKIVDEVAKSVDAEPQPQVVAVELAVTDVAESTRFFAEVLGFSVRQQGGRAFVGSLLILSNRKTHAPVDAVGSVITLVVSDLDRIESRALNFPGIQVVRSPDRIALWLKEPGDNVIRVLESHTGPSSTHEPIEPADAPSPSPAHSPASASEVDYVQDTLFDHDSERAGPNGLPS